MKLKDIQKLIDEATNARFIAAARTLMPKLLKVAELSRILAKNVQDSNAWYGDAFDVLNALRDLEADE